MPAELTSAHVTGAVALLPADIPVDPARDEARSAARRELNDPAYSAHEPSLWERAANWVIDFVKAALDGAQAGAPSGPWAAVGFFAVLVLIALVVRAKLGPMARSARRGDALFSGTARSAADHHRAADAALAAGDLATALQERFRALVRGLEERGIVAARPGYTADEAAAEAARQLPGCADRLRAAARAFDDVRYGDRPATADGHRLVAEADSAARAARPVLAEAAAGPPPELS